MSDTDSSRTAVAMLIAYAEDRLRQEAGGVADQILDDLDRLDEVRAEVERLRAVEVEARAMIVAQNERAKVMKTEADRLREALETWAEAADHPNGFIRRALEESRAALKGNG